MDHVKLELARPCLLNKSEYLKLAKANINIHNQTIVSSNCYFNEPTLVYGSCYLYRIKMDSYSYINYSSDVQNSSIGRYCCIGSNCNIGMPFHNYKAFSSSSACNSQSAFLGFSGSIDYMPQWMDKRNYIMSSQVHIGHDVWIGAHVRIPADVSIGHGAVVGTGAVIKKDVPPYAIINHRGEHLKNRFSDEIIADLLELNWWDYDLPRMISKKMIDPSFQESPQGIIELMRSQDTSSWLRIEQKWRALLVFSADKSALIDIDPQTDQNFSSVNLPADMHKQIFGKR